MKKIVAIVFASIGFTLASLSADAGTHDWHRHHYDYHHHYYHHNDGGAIAAGILGATVLGIVAGAEMSQHESGYVNSCREIYYTQHCDYDDWGDEDCYPVRHVYFGC